MFQLPKTKAQKIDSGVLLSLLESAGTTTKKRDYSGANAMEAGSGVEATCHLLYCSGHDPRRDKNHKSLLQ